MSRRLSVSVKTVNFTLGRFREGPELPTGGRALETDCRELREENSLGDFCKDNARAVKTVYLF